MKHLNKFSVLALSALAFTACDDLDADLKDYYVTSDQKSEVLNRNPQMTVAGVSGIFATYSTFMTVYSNHFDFGYPGVMLGLDLQTADMVAPYTGYNWFRYWSGFTSPDAAGTPAGMAWYHIYDQIFTCNAVAKSMSPDTEDPTIKFSRAQAVAQRAWDYFTLAQLFQFNYQLVPDAKCVPLVLDTNDAEVAEHGAPRATVTEVYTQVLKDIDEAISLLGSTTTTASDMIDSKPKRMISLATAYGIRARVHLTMGKYAEAQADAEAAIANFNGAPYSMKDVSKPSFVYLDDASWMWGIAIAETDRVVTSGIVNWPSMMVTFCDGYVNVGAWRYCASDLYKAIPVTDVRKGWFLNEDLQSKNLSVAQQAYLDSYAETLEPYTNVKFDSYNSVLGASVNANDIVLMRIEEMYYIKAEAMARQGQGAAAKEFFTKFIQTYRNPNYMMSAESNADIAEAIYQDKRVEFWGEGIAFFDYMRLNRPVDRIGKNWAPQESFNIPSYSLDTTPDKTVAGVLIYCIPQGEINGNPMISDADNNPYCTPPNPGQKY